MLFARVWRSIQRSWLSTPRSSAPRRPGRTISQLTLLEPRLCLSAGSPSADPVVSPLIHVPAAMPLVAAAAENFRFASSTNTIYVTGPVTATLSDVHTFLPKAPLALVDQVLQVWQLDANLILQDGATLQLHGSEVGGDVDQLRLRSNNVADSTTNYVELRADWGNLDIRSTKITSWDAAAAGPDTEYELLGRAYIRARSKLAADGVTPLQSRMDVVDSEIAYLGFDKAESYGLVWKVAGTTSGILGQVDVFGDVTDSFLHHNYFGMYTFGHFGGQWTGNEVANNVKYGIDPHDDSDNLLIEGNYVHDNGTHGIIASQRCDHVIIRNNISSHNAGNGIMLHRLSDDGLIEGNTTEFNGDSGISLFDSHRTIVRDNISRFNRRGFRLSVGTSDSVIEDNTLSFNTERGMYTYSGTDLPAAGDGRPSQNTFRHNRVEGNGTEGMYIEDSVGTIVENNEFIANGILTLRFLEGENNIFRDNTVPNDVALRVTGSPDHPSSAIVSGQPRLNVKLDEFSTIDFVDAQGAAFETTGVGPASVVTPTGSKLTLNFANMGGDSLVTTVGLKTTMPSGQVAVDPLSWEATGPSLKEFTAQAAAAGQSAQFVVSGLTPGETYVVSRNDAAIGNSVADVDGQVTLTAAFDSTALATFRLQIDSPPTPPPSQPGVIEGESFARRTDGAPTGSSTAYRWFKVTSETGGAGSFTGATGQYVQALRASDATNAGGKSLTAPSNPSIEFDVNVTTAGNYLLDVRAAGLGTGSDSLWVEILGATSTAGAGPRQLNTSRNGQFAWIAASTWNLAAGQHTIRISMREAGAAVDAVRLVGDGTATPPPEPPPSQPPTLVPGVTEAESYTRRIDGPAADPYRWFVGPIQTAGAGTFTGATGQYLQVLRASDGTNAGGKSLTTPGEARVEYDITVSTAGIYQLDVRAAGLSASSDSLWAEVVGATRAGGAGPQLSTNTTGQFAWISAGRWNLAAGVYTIRVSLREAGVGLDAIRLVAAP